MREPVADVGGHMGRLRLGGLQGGRPVVKIAVHEELCIDKNGNGQIDTCRDDDGDGHIEPQEMLPKGQGECVLFLVKADPAEQVVRAVGVDEDHYARVRLWNTKQLKGLMPDDGSVVATVKLQANPYGLVIDQDGIIWISGRGGNVLVSVDPQTLATKNYPAPSCGDSTLYGIGLDKFCKVWLGNSECNFVLRFDPVTESFQKVPINVGLGRTRGIVGDQNGYVYVAHHTWTCQAGRSITKIDALAGQVVGVFSLANSGVKGTVGVAMDADGYLWAVNQCANTATKIDPTSGTDHRGIPRRPGAVYIQ